MLRGRGLRDGARRARSDRGADRQPPRRVRDLAVSAAPRRFPPKEWTIVSTRHADRRPSPPAQHLAGVGVGWCAGARVASLPHPNDSDVPRSGSDSPAGHYAASGERAHYPGAGADADTLPALAYRNPQPGAPPGGGRSASATSLGSGGVGPRPRREHSSPPQYRRWPSGLRWNWPGRPVPTLSVAPT